MKYYDCKQHKIVLPPVSEMVNIPVKNKGFTIFWYPATGHVFKRVGKNWAVMAGKLSKPCKDYETQSAKEELLKVFGRLQALTFLVAGQMPELPKFLR